MGMLLILRYAVCWHERLVQGFKRLLCTQLCTCRGSAVTVAGRQCAPVASLETF